MLDCLAVSTSGQGDGSTLAVSRSKGETREDGHAEVIDLVQLPSGTRPTPIAYLDYEDVERCRFMDCEHYQNCLAFAAEVRWRSFHCRQCPKNPERVSAKGADLDADDGERHAAIIKLH